MRLNVIFSLVFMLFANCSYSLEPLQPFKWSDPLAKAPSTGNGSKGAQIFHFKTANKPYVLSKEATQFVNLNFENAAELKSDAETLKFASDSVTIRGAYIELGVCTGRTINLIAALNPHTLVYGFDSFEGLPEDWVRKDFIMPKGTFSFKDSNSIPAVLDNVQLFKGWFNKTLPQFVAEYLKNDPIALLHFDSDIYSSTKEGLNTFRKNIIPGTIIIFDEYYNYPGFEAHEHKAFQEFLNESKLDAEYIAFNGWHEQVVVRVKNRS